MDDYATGIFVWCVMFLIALVTSDLDGERRHRKHEKKMKRREKFYRKVVAAQIELERLRSEKEARKNEKS